MGWLVRPPAGPGREGYHRAMSSIRRSSIISDAGSVDSSSVNLQGEAGISSAMVQPAVPPPRNSLLLSSLQR